MAGRFNDWHHLKVRGDKALAARYLQEGRKWLGFLLEQQAIGGQQQVLEKINAAGVIFTADLALQQPILTIDVTRVRVPKVIPVVLEGFIVRPSDGTDQYANDDKNHVLMQPNSTEFRPWFYDEAHTPAAYTEAGAKLYGQLFPDGIGRYGNVDWRAADQSVVLSWMGPSARYFGYGGNDLAMDYYVFLHGQVLFDANADGALDFITDIDDYTPDSPIKVRGAATRGNWLYVALRDDGFHEFLVRYPLTSEMQKQAQAGGFDAQTVYFADVTCEYGGAELLLFEETDDFSGFHPYFFDSDASEARRIYYDFVVDKAIEEILTETDDGWIKSTASITITATETWTAAREYAPQGSYTYTYYTESGGVYTPHTFSGQHPIGWDDVDEMEAHNYIEPITSSTITHTNVQSSDVQKIGVDFWDGTWRYAYEYLGGFNNTSEYTCSMSTSSTIDDGYYHHTGVEETFDGVPTDQTVDFEVSVTGAESFADRDGGFRCDFLDRTFGTNRTVTISYAGTSGGTLFYPKARPPTDAPSASIIGDTGTEYQSADYSYSSVSSESELYIEYLDLRFDTVYYHTRTQTNSDIYSGSKSGNSFWEITGIDGGGAPIYDESSSGSFGWSVESMPRTLTEQVVWETFVIINGTQIEHIVQTDAPTESDTTITLDLDPNGDWLYAFTTVPGYSPTPPTPQIVAGLFANALGFVMSTITAWSEFPDSWHAVYALLTGPGGSVPDDMEFLDEASGSSSFFSPQQGAAETTVDFFEYNLDNVGSWPYVLGRYLASYQRPDERNSLDQYALFANRAGADTLLEAYDTAVRLYPVGYLSKVVLALSGTEETR